MESKEQSYDFYGMGIRYANEGLMNLKKVAEEIGQRYGTNAQLEFETGIAMTIPTYSQIVQSEITPKEMESGKSEIGMPNTRNNSYFGGSGTSTQYINKADGTQIYNEPHNRNR